METGEGQSAQRYHTDPAICDLAFRHCWAFMPKHPAKTVKKVNELAPREPSNPPLAELLIGPPPSCRNHTDYRSSNGEFTCGTWDSTPYHRRAMSYRHYELMHLLEGEVTLVDGAGRSQTFRSGDVLLCEQGAECSWYSAVHVAKVFAIYRPN